MTTLKTDFRPIRNAGIHRIIGQLYSQKNRAFVQWESQIERDFFLTCEHAHYIKSYRAQAAPVELWVEGKRRAYTADARLELVKVNRADPAQGIVEVKPDQEYAKPAVRALLDAAELYYSREGYRFDVILESEIRIGYRIENLRALYRYAGAWVTQEVRRIIATLITDAPEPTVGWVVERLNRHCIPNESLFSLMFHGDIDFELDKYPLSYDTLLTWAGR